MASTPEDLKVEIDGLRYEIRVAKKSVPDFSKRHFNSTREKALIFCLQRSIDLAEGCDLLVEANLLSSVYVLTRGLLENLIWARWISLSDENAKIFTEAPTSELKRIAKEFDDRSC
jgi:hypothetical protein